MWVGHSHLSVTLIWAMRFFHVASLKNEHVICTELETWRTRSFKMSCISVFIRLSRHLWQPLPTVRRLHTFTSQQWPAHTNSNTRDMCYFGDINQTVQKVYCRCLVSNRNTQTKFWKGRQNKGTKIQERRPLIQLEAIDQRLEGRQKQTGSR